MRVVNIYLRNVHVPHHHLDYVYLLTAYEPKYTKLDWSINILLFCHPKFIIILNVHGYVLWFIFIMMFSLYILQTA